MLEHTVYKLFSVPPCRLLVPLVAHSNVSETPSLATASPPGSSWREDCLPKEGKSSLSH